MIKVKDGYGKLIGTTYQGSAAQVLLSNGGNLEFSSETKANTLVQRNASQHIYATYFNSAISDEALTDIGSVYVRNTSDTFIRRISKTQFYSIIDNKFVTLDTAQTITGVKTFSTGPILANNATITQNQNSTSNYTTVVKWLKGGTSQGTYNPSIGQHNTGGDGTGSICILPYPTSADPWGGTVGLFISKGVLRLDGKAVAIAENYYTKTESDERYVNVTGDTMTGPLIVKASITGTQLISNIADGTAPLKVTSKTVVTNLNSDLLDGYHETSFFRARGSQTIASSIPTTTELSSNNNLSGNWNVTYPGASGHLVQFNTGSGSTRYMQFYSYYSGSLYWRNSTDSTLNTKSWKTIVDSANYTGIVLKIGTATKGSATLPIYLNAGTPTACSTTLGVSITGNAATATKLQTARTINGTSFDGSANITTAYWGATRTITLSGAVTGSASVNGSQNVTITTTYQTGSIDGRYVGGKKTAGHGSQGTAYTADTYSSNFVNKAFVAYAERGSWAYANNGYITTDTGVNIPLAGTAIFQWGASDTNKTQLFITPHNNSGVSNPAANEMLFYTSNGSGYTSAWTRVLTHRNYTTYTVTKTGGGASGTWGISITGTAAAARKIYKIDGTSRTWSTADSIVGNGLVSYTDTSTSGRWDNYGSIFQFSNLDNPTPGTSNHWLTQIWSGTSNKLGVRWRTNTGGWSSMQTILTNTNYVSYADTRYVTALGTNGNYVTWTKNGTTNNLTVPYATASIRVNSSSSVQNTGLTYYSSGSFVVGGTAAGGQWGMPSDSQDASYKNGQCLRMYWSSAYYTDILSGPNNMGTTHGLYLRQIINGSVATGTFPGGWRLLLDSYNYQRYGDSRYVTLTTNQTVSGIKTFSTQQKFTVATGTSPFTVSSTTVVSNLNADLLDGYHASSFESYRLVVIDASGLNNNTWYPVTMSIGNSLQTRIRIEGNTNANATWNSRSDKNMALILDYTVNGSSWGWTGVSRAIHRYTEGAGTSSCLRGLGQLTNSSIEYVFVRGGAKYNFYVSRFIVPTLRTSTYTSNSQSVSPTTTAPAAIATPSLTFSAGRFSALTYYPITGINTVNIPTNTSHLTNDSGFWTGTRYWANIAVSTSSSTSTSPTFSTAYTSNWFRSTGSTGWYSQTYGGGWYMSDSTWIRTFGSKSVYQDTGQIRTDGYLVTNGGLTAGATSPNNGTYKLHVTGASWSSGLIRAGGGFYHNSVNSNSYVLLAGGSYKGLGDFAKGNAGSATKGVYVTGGTVTAMTYSLSSNLNSGTSGKLAYYSSATTVAAYTSSVGATNRGVYMNAGVPTVMTYYLNATVNSGTSGKLAYYSSTNALSSYTTTVGSTHQPVYMSSGVPTICGYSFKGSSRQPIVLLSGVFYRSGTTWYMDSARTHKVVDATPSITISGARMQITLPGTTISSGVVTQEQTTDFSASSTVDVNSHGNGAYGFAVYSNVGNYVYVRTWCQRNDKNHSWASNGRSWTTFLMRIQVTLFGYIN